MARPQRTVVALLAALALVGGCAGPGWDKAGGATAVGPQLRTGSPHGSAQEAQGLGLFLRGLVGLDRGAAKEAFADFLAAHQLNSNQIEFVNLIIDSLAEHGVVDAARLYELPFTDLAPLGPEGLFNEGQGTELVDILGLVRVAAEAA